jgi:3D-(3,5/4)-trihydroxycyclohexane-1,2-dione acylhydrolase (decyclizing)
MALGGGCVHRRGQRGGRQRDVVIGIGTCHSDFHGLRDPVRRRPLRQLNITGFDAAALRPQVVGDARESIVALGAACRGWATEPAYRATVADLTQRWTSVVDRARHADPGSRPTQTAVIGAVNDAAGPRDVVVCAAGSMPGDLHRLWRGSDAKAYHVEYGYSCMGMRSPAGSGQTRRARPRGFVLVGDGST